ncbi:sigma-70 family RNA polymerase sigma factor [Nocardioides alcanivorans]|uniref:sigma-70 family RNA polymerase sigma factor n=1 Tax=Nocardioides alcanivorans TaxID=2897352 RepID=UPI001F32DA45|nr:sigma-70 family RNA polymerase sigma factor [Nocardioides alcanivorans]
MERHGTTNPYEGISRDQRRRLTTGLLAEARHAEGETLRELLDQVVMVNMCVARSIAARYRSRGISQDDLEQVANAALVRAVHNFDGDREGDLLSYAVPSIRGELRRHFRDQGWTVRPPRRIQELQSRVVEERDRRVRDRDSSAEADIALALDVPVADVVEALAAEGCFTPTSLDLPVGEDGGATLGELLPDPDNSGDRAAAEARVMLRPVVRRLPERDRKLLKMRFFDELTQQEIADDFGVTQTQVSRLLSRVLADLRRGLGELAPESEPRSGERPTS